MNKDDVYARMMHTPDDPIRAELRAGLREMWKQLMPLHRALIDSASGEYSATVAPTAGPGHLLQLLQDDPFFSWLKPITSLIVEIDSMSRTDFERAQIDQLIAKLENLFGASADPGFADRYVPVLQRNVDVAIAHAAVMQTIAKLKHDMGN